MMYNTYTFIAMSSTNIVHVLCFHPDHRVGDWLWVDVAASGLPEVNEEAVEKDRLRGATPYGGKCCLAGR
jgi:hypothetical protein